MEPSSASTHADSATEAVRSCVAKLLSRALCRCCAASEGAGEPGARQVWVELVQQSQLPGFLLVKVSDNGLGLPADEPAIQLLLAPLAPLLLHPALGGSLNIRTAGEEEEESLRLYQATATGAAGTVVLREVGRQDKPLRAFEGSEFELSVRLHSVDPQEVGSSVEQVLCMLRALAPPARLGVRLQGVIAQDDAGARQAVTGSKLIAAPPDASLSPLQQLKHGLASEFPSDAEQPCGPGAGAAAAAASADGGGGGGRRGHPGSSASQRGNNPGAASSVARSSSSRAGRQGQLGQDGEQERQAVRDEEEGQARQQQQQPMTTHVGVGEAGWGSEGSTVRFRGCRWTARAGLVLRLPDYQALGEQPPNTSLESESTLFLFRNFELQQGEAPQEACLKGLQRCDWAEYGLALASAGVGEDGVLCLRLRWAQPGAGAVLTAGVVDVRCGKMRHEALTGRAYPLGASYEARLVRAAVEGALGDLKASHPGVLANRRERSLQRAVPSIAQSVAGILSQSHNPAFVQQALATLGVGGAEAVPAKLDALLSSAARNRMEQLSEEAAAAARERRSRQRTGGGRGGGE